MPADSGTRAALILSAGRSERMGRDKATLPYGDARTFHDRAVELARIGVPADRVVTVAAPGQLRSGLVAVNPAPARGMFSSVQVGVRAVLALSPPAQACLLLPVDHSTVAPGTVSALWDACDAAGWQELGALVPTYRGAQGHPVVLTARALAVVARADAGDRLDRLLEELGFSEVFVDDPGVVRNLNTPERYDAWWHARSLDPHGGGDP